MCNGKSVKNFNKNWQEARAEIGTRKDYWREMYEEGQITEAEYGQKIRTLDRMELALDTLGMGLGSPSNSVSGSLMAAASPAVTRQIGAVFKPGGALQEYQNSPVHWLAQGIWAAAVAYGGGNDPLSAGLGAAGAEAAAPKISNWLYGTSDPQKLTAEQKQTVSSITGLLGAGTGALAGGSTENAAAGSLAARNAVENNEFSIRDLGISEAAQRNLHQQAYQEVNHFVVNANSPSSEKSRFFSLLEEYNANKSVMAEVTAAFGLGLSASASINESGDLVLTISGTAGYGFSGFAGFSSSSKSRDDGWFSEVCAAVKAGGAFGSCVGANLSRGAPLINSVKGGIGYGLSPVEANANIGYQRTIKLTK